jgi:hypothetical protein
MPLPLWSQLIHRLVSIAHGEHDCSQDAKTLFISFLVLSMLSGTAAILGVVPPDPAVHWPGHKWIHFMKRLHVIMSIGCFLVEVCASSFALFALQRILSGGFDTHAKSTAALLVRELEFEYVAVCSYAFGGAWLLMGPVAIRCFCMVQQGLRSDALAAAVCCLIAGGVLLVLSFFNESILASFPYESYDMLILRFVELSLLRCRGGGKHSVITILAWSLQAVCVLLFALSLVETIPFVYYRELDRQSALEHAAADLNSSEQEIRAARRLRSASAENLDEKAMDADEDDEAMGEDAFSREGSDMLAPLEGARRTPPMGTPTPFDRRTPAGGGGGGGGGGGMRSGSSGGPSPPAAPAAAALWGFGPHAVSGVGFAPSQAAGGQLAGPGSSSAGGGGGGGEASATGSMGSGGRIGTLNLLGSLSARPRSAAGGVNALRASPVPTAEELLHAGAAPTGCAVPLGTVQAWTVALAHTDPKLPTGSSGGTVVHGSGGSMSSHRRTPSGGDGRQYAVPYRPCSKVSSIASSMVSLDSTVID